MSTPLRWIVAILIFAAAAALAALGFFGGVFSTVGCMEVPPGWVYYLALAAALVLLAASAAVAVMIVRRSRPIAIIGALAGGALLSCGGFGGYLMLLGGYC